MEISLQKAREFQDWVQSAIDLFSFIPFNRITSFHVISAAVLVVCSYISYRLGRKEESESLLSDKVKHQLELYESDVQAVNKQIASNELRLTQIRYFQILVTVISLIFMVNQGLTDHTDASMFYAGGALLGLNTLSFLCRSYLFRSIKQLNFKIQEDKNQQTLIVQQLYAEMTDQMRKILSGMISTTALKECEQEKETIKRAYEMRIKSLQSEGDQERERLRKSLEAKLQEAAQPISNGQNQFNSLCSTPLCKSKKRIMKEKIKRNDWFIQNLSEFAWCQVCASHMFQDPNRSFIAENEQLSQPSMNLDDSILLNTTMQDETQDEEDKEENDRVFNELLSMTGQAVIRSDCENSCLTKYFVLCKKIGNKFNQWSDRIEAMETKYQSRKEQSSSTGKAATKQK